MTKKLNIIILFVVGLLCLFPVEIFAKNVKYVVAGSNTDVEKSDSIKASGVKKSSIDTPTGSLFPEKNKNLSFSHFTWGAEIGSSIDVTGHDMSTFNVDVLLGYKNSFIKMLGVGAGIHRSVQMGNNFVPIYAVLRTSCTNRPSLFFLNVQMGYSFNTIENSDTFGDFTSSLGVGVNLSQNRRAKSYIILSAGCHNLNRTEHNDRLSNVSRIYFANLAFGVNF